MDPLGGIIAILQLSANLLAHLNDVENATKECAQCASETASLRSLLFQLRARLEEENYEKSWYTAVKALFASSGPLNQFKRVLEILQTKMTDDDRSKKSSEASIWNFIEEEVAGMPNQVERLSTLIKITLEMNHM